MKISDLQKAVKIVSKVSNNSSMSELFRCVELSSEAIRCCSEYGNIEVWLSIPEITTPILVNTLAFAAVVNSLPETGDLQLTLTPTQLNWKCGSAKGHLAFPSVQRSIPVIPNNKNFSWNPPKDFPDAIELASTACQSMTVSIGLFGVVVEPLTNTLRMTSSNNNSLATTQIKLDGYPTKETITLRPPVPTILATILKAEPQAVLDIEPGGVFILSPSLVAHLPLSQPLEHSLGVVIDRFTVETDIIKINSKAIDRFLSRAKALTDKTLPVEVHLQIANGNIILQQNGGAASSEEYFLADDVDKSKVFSSVVLPLNLLVPSLQHCERAVLDYLDKNILVLRGSSPDFRHIVGGKSK